MSKIIEVGGTAFLSGSATIVTLSNSTGFLDDTRDNAITVTPKSGAGKREIEFIPWGQDNNRPLEILEKVYGNITTASNIDFNSRINVGDGVLVVRKELEAGKLKFVPVLDSEEPEIFSFLQDNNVNRIMQEAASDLAVFSDGYAELICNNDNNAPKIVQLRYKEATHSRLSMMNEKTGRIDYHGYSAKWSDRNSLDDVIATPFLDRDAPIYDLKDRLGFLPDKNGKKKMPVKDKRFVMSLSLPTPGRFYYPKPYWWSIFPSRWYDFACSVPLFKTALIENEMVLKYHVKINNRFWERLYTSEGITDVKKKTERRTAFLLEMDNFLSGKENAGKSFVSHFNIHVQSGKEEQDIVIEPIESFLKGGEYIEDYEEASNAICYAMGVHPSLQGANPGKGKSINGTEARELFIIKQAITKPVRDAMILPLYAIKAINKWNPDIHFVIPNIMLTTLDKNTGSEKSVGNQAL